ncbi:MAG TPA: response regulator, partial [Bacteroidales bacterium]|nr:response regulator [Bacteroidales bacterium]
MRRILIIVNITFLLIMLSNFFYYNNLYRKQVNYILELLNRQVQIVGNSVDETNNGFETDLNQIAFDEDLTFFFSDKEKQRVVIEKMKLFFSKYQDFTSGMKLYDNEKNEITLRKDTENESGKWLESPPFIMHIQPKIFRRDTLIRDGRKFNYILPVIDKKTDSAIGNLVVTVDYQKYFDAIFNTFNLQDYQWQWVLSDTGNVIYDNYPDGLLKNYTRLDRIAARLAEGSVDNITHKAEIEGETREIISSFYSTQLLKRELGIVFSAPTDFFQKYIIRNSIFIVTGTLILIQFIVFIFYRHFKKQKKELNRLENSEKMLFSLIDEMPVGVIIHNKNGEIIRANKVAAEQYSYKNEAEMMGKLFPESSNADGGNGLVFDPDGKVDAAQLVVIKKEIGEIVLYRKSIPVTFNNEEATMEMLTDVTLLESARKHEARANEAKSEFLARMSYEIRTPLNGIIGMTDVLNKFELAPQVREIIRLLRSSTEVLLNIINDILDFSRIETGKMILDESPFNIRHEINYCVDLARTNLPLGVELISAVDTNVPENIVGDPFRLRQVITNLLNHSAKNTEQGEIRLNCMLKGKLDGQLTLGFEILDTGRSFDKAAFKKIFGDFVNVESKTLKSNDESSFGTVLAKQLIELMGGMIIAESPSGLSGDEGTRIYFSLNTYSNDRIEKTLDVSDLKSLDKVRTLAITGNQNRDEETLAALKRIGLPVTVTTFMKTTIHQLKVNLNHHHDRYKMLVIFDEPEFNGFEAAQAIWDSNLSRNYIILLISSNDRKGNYLKSISLGIDHYLVKPFTDAELADAVKGIFPLIGTEAPQELPAARKDIKILIVEDNKMNQIVFGTMLKNLGYTYDLAEDGFAGLLQARAVKYDLIFMDLFMPEMDGFESARKILKSDESVIIVAF